MIFTLNLLYSLWCSSKLGFVYEHSNIKKCFFSYFLLFTPLWIFWLLICGGQYGIGTDYFNYYDIFKNVASDYYYGKSEWLFAWIVDIGHVLNLPPQGLFFIFYFINFLFYFYILFLLERRTAFIFVLLYITLSTVFNNQLNGLRQYSAIYIITFAIVNFYENKSYFKYICWILFAAGLHFSSYIALPFCFFFRMKNILNAKICYTLIAIGTLFSLIGISTWITKIFGTYIPDNYLGYIDGGFNKSSDSINVITKLVFVPIYLLSVNYVFSKKIEDKDKYFYVMGILAYTIRLFFLENFIFDRVGQLFILVAILPIYVYMKYLYIDRKKKMCLFMILLFIAFYMVKTLLFPNREYLYQSIYFM